MAAIVLEVFFGGYLYEGIGVTNVFCLGLEVLGCGHGDELDGLPDGVSFQNLDWDVTRPSHGLKDGSVDGKPHGTTDGPSMGILDVLSNEQLASHEWRKFLDFASR